MINLFKICIIGKYLFDVIKGEGHVFKNKVSHDYHYVTWWIFGLLNETLLTTALPSIMKDFHIQYSQVQWLTTAFYLPMEWLFHYQH